MILESFILPSEIRTQLQQILKNVTDIGDHIVGHFVDTMMENDQSPAGKDRKLLIELAFNFKVIRYKKVMRTLSGLQNMRNLTFR